MDSLEQQLRAGRDKLRRRMDWRPGEDTLPRGMPMMDMGIYLPPGGVVTVPYRDPVIQEVDQIIHRMMGCETPGDAVD